jgi:2-dehydropantoate 2-reductase
MKIAIVGQGAIGSLFTYYFRTLNPVLLVKNTCTKVKTIINLDGQQTSLDFPKHLVSSPSPNHNKPPEYDCLVIAIKGYQVAQLIAQIQPWLTSNTRLILIQNGMGGAQLLAKAFPNNLIYTGTTTDAVFAKTDTYFQITAHGRLDIGPLWEMLDSSEYAPWKNHNAKNILAEKHWIDTFLAYHPLGVYHKNVAQALYTKLAINAVINPLTAVLQIKNGALKEHPNKVETLKQEVFAVYKSMAIEHSPAALSQAIDLVIETTAENWSSMCQDVKLKRLTENETVLGFLVQAAKRKALNTPLMFSLYQTIANIDASLKS